MAEGESIIPTQHMVSGIDTRWNKGSTDLQIENNAHTKRDLFGLNIIYKFVGWKNIEYIKPGR